MKTISRLLFLAVSLMLASCGAKKVLVSDSGTRTTVQTTAKADGAESMAARRLAFVQKVSDQKVYAKNIVADMSFTATMGEKKITVPGAVRMRRDEMIRLQLFIPLLGSEVGRIEFTPEGVLVIDRMHKQYVKGSYDQLDFLKNNGLNFYTLQALFWNELLLPGASKVGEADLRTFEADIDEMGDNVPVKLTRGKMSYQWTADRSLGRISRAQVSYGGEGRGRGELTWDYAEFKPLGSKFFPSKQEFSFATTATSKVQKVTVKLDMNALKTSDDWDVNTTISSRYKQMDAKDVLGKLLNM